MASHGHQSHGHAAESHGHGHGHGHGSDSHGHHESKFKNPMPDWRQYKIDGIKQLEWTQKELAKRGLKDPWLRNEVWRYQNWPGVGRSFFSNLFRGFKWAFAAMVVTVAVDQAFGISRSQQHHHGHHGDDHHGEHGLEADKAHGHH